MKVPPKKMFIIGSKIEFGTSFYFKLNGKPVFMKGANYIPQDVFLPRVTDRAYHKIIEKVVEKSTEKIKEIVNTLKNREWYRPFAGIILEKEFKNYFATEKLDVEKLLTSSRLVNKTLYEVEPDYIRITKYLQPFLAKIKQ